jgi:outer membrane protein TolC
MSLEEAISLGLRNNRTIRSSQLHRVSQKFDLKVEENKFTPQLVVNSSYISNRDSFNGSSATRSFTPTATVNTPTGGQISVGWENTSIAAKGQNSASDSALTLTFLQPLLRNAGTDIAFASVHMARINENINLLTLKSTVNQALTNIVFSYRDLLRAQDQLDIAKNALKRSKDLMEVNRALIVAGRMAEIDLIQTEADVSTQELASEEAENDVDAARLALLSLIAIDSRTPVRATDKLSIKPVYVDVNDALLTAYENQPEYLSALLSVELAKSNLMLAKNQRLWDLSLVAATSYNKNSSPFPNNAGFDNHKSNYVGLQLTIPINDLTPEQAQIHAATDLEDKNLQIEGLRQSIEQVVRDAVRNVQTRWRQVQIAQRGRDLSIKKVEAEREKLRVGRSSNFQVLAYEGDLRNAESSLLNTTIAYLNALTTLEQQQGKTLDLWKISLDN